MATERVPFDAESFGELGARNHAGVEVLAQGITQRRPRDIILPGSRVETCGPWSIRRRRHLLSVAINLARFRPAVVDFKQ
jgi:hypothetical protein